MEHLEGLAKELTCSICLSVMEAPVARLPCCHYFCLDCINQSVRHKPLCPVCKCKASRRDVSRDGTMDRVVAAFAGVQSHKDELAALVAFREETQYFSPPQLGASQLGEEPLPLPSTSGLAAGQPPPSPPAVAVAAPREGELAALPAAAACCAELAEAQAGSVPAGVTAARAAVVGTDSPEQDQQPLQPREAPGGAALPSYAQPAAEAGVSKGEAAQESGGMQLGPAAAAAAQPGSGQQPCGSETGEGTCKMELPHVCEDAAADVATEAQAAGAAAGAEAGAEAAEQALGKGLPQAGCEQHEAVAARPPEDRQQPLGWLRGVDDAEWQSPTASVTSSAMERLFPKRREAQLGGDARRLSLPSTHSTPAKQPRASGAQPVGVGAGQVQRAEQEAGRGPAEQQVGQTQLVNAKALGEGASTEAGRTAELNKENWQPQPGTRGHCPAEGDASHPSQPCSLPASTAEPAPAASLVGKPTAGRKGGRAKAGPGSQDISKWLTKQVPTAHGQAGCSNAAVSQQTAEPVPPPQHPPSADTAALQQQPCPAADQSPARGVPGAVGGSPGLFSPEGLTPGGVGRRLDSLLKGLDVGQATPPPAPVIAFQTSKVPGPSTIAPPSVLAAAAAAAAQRRGSTSAAVAATAAAAAAEAPRAEGTDAAGRPAEPVDRPACSAGPAGVSAMPAEDASACGKGAPQAGQPLGPSKGQQRKERRGSGRRPPRGKTPNSGDDGTPGASHRTPAAAASAVVAAAGPGTAEAAGGSERRVPSRLVQWSCGACTFLNKPQRRKCQMCSTPKPSATSAPAAQLLPPQPQGEGAQPTPAQEGPHPAVAAGKGRREDGGAGQGSEAKRARLAAPEYEAEGAAFDQGSRRVPCPQHAKRGGSKARRKSAAAAAPTSAGRLEQEQGGTKRRRVSAGDATAAPAMVDSSGRDSPGAQDTAVGRAAGPAGGAAVSSRPRRSLTPEPSATAAGSVLTREAAPGSPSKAGEAGCGAAAGSHWLGPKKTSWVLLGSGLDQQGRERLAELAVGAGASVAYSWGAGVTHVVCGLVDGAARRTLKFLMAILAGKWVVGEAWVDACLREGRAVDEAAYQVSRDSNGCEGGAAASRHSAALGLPPLLHGYEVHLAGEFSSREDVLALLKAAGARQLARMPAVHSMPGAGRQRGPCTSFVLCELPESAGSSPQQAQHVSAPRQGGTAGGGEGGHGGGPDTGEQAAAPTGPAAGAAVQELREEKWYARAVEAGVPVVSCKWLMDSVGSYTLRPLEQYTL